MIALIKSTDIDDMELFGLDDFVLPEGDDFDPVGIDEQGKLDETKIVIMQCPHCEKTFEQKQAKIID